MNPFEQVSIEIEKDGITYTYGATIVATYTLDSEEMAIVSIQGSGDVIHCKQSDLTQPK